MEERFPERLRRLRLRAGLTQKQLADAAGKSRPWITQLETATRWDGKLPPGDDLLRLADALGVAPGELMGRPSGTAAPAVPMPAGVADHALRVIPAPWFDLVAVLSRDEEFRATAEQIMELRRTQTPRVAQIAEEQLLGAWRKNAEMWRTIWALAQEAAQEAAREQTAERERALLPRDDAE